MIYQSPVLTIRLVLEVESYSSAYVEKLKLYNLISKTVIKH